MSVGDVHEQLPAVPQSLSLARAAMEEACRCLDVDEHTSASIRLAVSEACTNVVVHAYPGQATPGPLELHAGVAGDVMRVVVRDHGIGLVAQPDSPGARLGLPLMTALAQRLEIRRAEGAGTTEVIMDFDLADSGSNGATEP
jgi:anti-sigma regulatory factor (Ser/Thr protein kinase)